MANTNTVRISINYVQIGMICAENVFNSSGLLLVPKQASLTQIHLFRMKLYQIMSILVYTTDDIDFISFSKTTMANKRNKLDYNKNYQSFLSAYHIGINTLKKLFPQVLNKESSIRDEFLLLCNNITQTLSSPNDLFAYLFHLSSNPQKDTTHVHCLNVGLLCRIIGSWLRMTEDQLDELSICGLLHDFGKLDIDTSILRKSGKLTAKEYDLIKDHPFNGYQHIKSTNFTYGVKMAVLQHHERFDGSGYPFGFCEEQIHDNAKIVAIADIYDAMTSDRSYHKRMHPFKVIAIFEKEAYGVLDSHFLKVFLENLALLYVGKSVILTNGDTGKIVFINRKAPSRPLIQVGSKIYNLEFEHGIEVTDVL